MPIDNAVHLCVDMQRIFARGGIWETPWMERVLPTIVELARRYAERTVFTRFITPASPQGAPGQWRCYLERWKIATRNALGDPAQLDLVPELAALVPPAIVVDKPTYSAFFRSPLASFLLGKGVRTVIVSGAETDVCVLSTVLDAVNVGFRVVLVEDALCSSSDEGHEALMTMYRLRFNEQIDLVTAEGLMEIWRPERER
jgi:nicotinamidase-related amidase